MSIGSLRSKYPPGTRIGMTTTIPVEIVYAAGFEPVDLNNCFITDEYPERFLTIAEEAGYPRNMCNWTKGLYGVMCDRSDIPVVIAVVRGDCSNTQALMETLKYRGIEIVPFAFPYDRSRKVLHAELQAFMETFGVSDVETDAARERLNRIRMKLGRLDTLSWQTDAVDSVTSHEFLVNSSDFRGNPAIFEQELDAVLAEFGPEYDNHAAECRPPSSDEHRLRLGYIGVPPIITDVFHYLEEQGGRVVYHEVSRQFSMPDCGGSLVDQYSNYTYPYDIFFRIEDIVREIDRRRIEGIIHYTQSFCFRQIEDIILRQEVHVPILTFEGERPGPLDERNKIRLETFLDMIRSRR